MRRVFREVDLHQIDGLRKTQRQKLIDEKAYPPPGKLNDFGRGKIWFEDEIVAWQEWRRAKRDGTAKAGSSWRHYLQASTAAAPTGATKTRMGGKSVDCVRVRAVNSNPPAPSSGEEEDLYQEQEDRV